MAAKSVVLSSKLLTVLSLSSPSSEAAGSIKMGMVMYYSFLISGQTFVAPLDNSVEVPLIVMRPYLLQHWIIILVTRACTSHPDGHECNNIHYDSQYLWSQQHCSSLSKDTDSVQLCRLWAWYACTMWFLRWAVWTQCLCSVVYHAGNKNNSGYCNTTRAVAHNSTCACSV